VHTVITQSRADILEADRLERETQSETERECAGPVSGSSERAVNILAGYCGKKEEDIEHSRTKPV